MMQIAEARKYYPHLKSGRIYMNHAAISPLSEPVVKELNDYIYIRSETEIENFPEYMKVFQDTKDKLGEMINCQASRIAFVDNTSNGLNILAQGLEWKAGDRIVLNDIEFPSNIYPFLNLKEQGVEIDFVKSHDGIVSFEDIEHAISSRTRLVSISHVQFLSGYRAEIGKIGELCRSKGIIFCVDAIQSAGALNVDVERMKIDFLAAGTQKWMMALQGLAFIFVTEELQEKIKPRYVGWTSVSDAWNLLNYDLKLRSSAERFQNGTLSTIGVIGLHGSLVFMRQFGHDKIEEAILSNTEYFMGRLNEAGIPVVLKGVEKKNLSGIVSIRSLKAQEVFDELEKRGVTAAVREGIVRFSPHFYNNREEIDRVVEILKELLP
ncbi:MAG: aminotransferase class V-fold PLP-dependent enzyme [Ignavibacteria bacterium]|jgi:selenocysteine lyase/cysteine desulfurase|nr:aminotransferase class V-fold PLP-dependent enzyme [Ignavibacteria bacterium]MCU7501969.1 aminotransferase class V-fold PLP-dependent enzyme [Ignavibacteria bacterium]MCU7516937.1 aminotransferase class V-fold PLP-dependent enzyme [Ignavibacteria bacterium]